jgi:8-oxo-dGTP pyrophosphatase MutT (NUDIX family)
MPGMAAELPPDTGPRLGPALPAGLAERARALARGELRPVPTRPAATVVLLRDGPAGPEAYLLRRVKTMAFAAGMYVFPGGSVDPRDRGLPPDRWLGAPPAGWTAALSADEALTRALVCAAVRETFEESGVLLAVADPSADRFGHPSAGSVADTRGADWERDRTALARGDRAFSEFLAVRGLRLHADLLRPWAHWITPEVEERRYDTRFFVAALPPGQQVRAADGEADRAIWLAPREAVRRHRAGELGMLPPTVVTLAELAAADSVAAVLAAADARRIRPRLPTVVLAADEARLLLPHLDDHTGAGRDRPGGGGAVRGAAG